MKNFIQSTIVNKSITLKARDKRLVDSSISFDIVELFENLTVLLAKTEIEIKKSGLTLPHFNQPFQMDDSKFKKEAFVNDTIVFWQNHCDQISMYFMYLKVMNEFYFGLNEINDYSNAIILSFSEAKILLFTMYNQYLTIKTRQLSTCLMPNATIINQRAFWIEVFKSNLSLQSTGKCMSVSLTELRDIFESINTNSKYSKFEQNNLYKHLKMLKPFTCDLSLYKFIVCSTYVYAFNKSDNELFIEKCNNLISNIVTSKHNSILSLLFK